MASVKIRFRPSTIEGKEGTVYYQIIQNRVIRQLKTDYRIFTDEWNEAGSCIIVGSSERSNLLLSGAPDKPCGVGRADANPKLLLNDT